jgi:hypothetical protein
MVDGMPAIMLATTTAIVAYATWWLVRHELAVRRFRAEVGRSGSRERA